MVRVGMVRLGLIVMVFALTGCSALRDAFSAHAQVAGTAAGQTLTVDRLAHVVGHAQRIPIRPDVLTGVANVYLDYAVFATELGRGRDLHDSALVLAAQWPVVAQLKWERYHDQLIATRGKLTPAQADSAFQAGTVRLFQHILIRIPQSAVPKVEQQKEQQATALLRQAATQRGMNFAQLARRYSEDPGSKTRGGYLPATPRGQFVPAFDSAAWTLPPGAVTAGARSERRARDLYGERRPAEPVPQGARATRNAARRGGQGRRAAHPGQLAAAARRARLGRGAA